MAANRKGPVLKWENNVAWPGKLTLTDKALYFQVFIVPCYVSVLYTFFPSGSTYSVHLHATLNLNSLNPMSMNLSFGVELY